MDPLRMTLRKSSIDRKERPLEVTAEHIAFDGQTMRWADVRDIRFGTVTMQVAGHNKDVVRMNEFAVRDAANKKLAFMFQAGFTQKGRDEVSDQFDRIIDAVDHFFLAQRVAETRARIKNGEAVTFGNARIEGGSLHYRKGFIFKKDVSVPLSEVSARIENGDLVLSAPRPVVFSSLLTKWNTVVVARALR